MLNFQENSLILVVDDSATNLEIISDAITNAGFYVATARNGEKALQQIQDKQPDLILLDVMMPVIDGFETCKKIKANPATQDIPVIFMTGISDTETKVQGLTLGAVDYITKPFQKEEVLARIKTHLQLRYLTKTLEQLVTERTGELSQALKDLQAYQIQLVQKEKMSALGQLVAGIAHEINNPVSCIHGNLGHAANYFQSLIKIIDLYQQNYPEPVPVIQEEITEIDLEYIRSDLPHLITSMKEGVQRIRNISTSLRNFSRADRGKVFCNIHNGIDSTIMILKHRLKPSKLRPEIEVIKNYGDLPSITCFSGQLNQVFMNILTNAIDALEESNLGRTYSEIEQNPNQILIETALTEDKNYAVISIKDNGVGMTPEVQNQIFEHLFTTKPLGRGTGLGLSIARQIILEKHKGSLDVYSVLGEGSEFVITIPVH